MNRGPSRPPMVIRGHLFAWGTRTYLMGILNLTPDSFSGDGLATDDTGTLDVAAVVAQAHRMVIQGAHILDVGAESTRPGHVAVSVAEESARLMPAIRAIRAASPDIALSVDSRKPEIAVAALAAGADMLNDVSGVTGDGALAAVAGAHGVPYVLMHDGQLGAEAPGSVATRVVEDLSVAIERAVSLGCRRRSIIVDPGFGFGKTPAQNLELLRDLDALTALGCPILLGASRKSTIGLVLGLPTDDRLEGTLATTALGIAGGVDLVRVHDVRANERVARMSDAIVRGWQPADQGRSP